MRQYISPYVSDRCLSMSFKLTSVEYDRMPKSVGTTATNMNVMRAVRFVHRKYL